MLACAPLSKTAQHPHGCPCLGCKRKKELGRRGWDTAHQMLEAKDKGNIIEMKRLELELQKINNEIDSL